ncbi:tyrosine-type recombinase/integrase [Streptomyces hygroscopicus]|uniref:tyrosine-type recombinase/integrase n=1 Tax=Streptomyces hygroscopicus TaxID=1912 RepID=UPI00367E9231
MFTTRSGLPLELRNLYRFGWIAVAAGPPRVRLHDTQHGCASLLFAAGFAPRVVMEILGHSQIAVTMNLYTHVDDDSRREAMGHMDRLLNAVGMGLPSISAVNAPTIQDRRDV